MANPPPFVPPAPSPEHAVFAKDVGTWDADVEIWLAPGAAAQTSRAVTVSRLVCGGRWLLTDLRNETTGFEGHGVYGYDAQKARYVSTWIDDMRPFLVIGEGTWDEAGRAMTFVTELPAGGRVVKLREVMRTIEDGVQIFSSFIPLPDGSEHEMMRVTYRRR